MDTLPTSSKIVKDDGKCAICSNPAKIKSFKVFCCFGW